MGDLFLLLLSFLNIAFWFLSAPDLRFGNVFFWISIGICSCVLFDNVMLDKSYSKLLVLVLFIYIINMFNILFLPKDKPQVWQIGRAEPRITRLVEIKNGQIPALRLNVPSSGDRCGDSVIPCTPDPMNELLLIEPGDISRGLKMGIP